MVTTLDEGRCFFFFAEIFLIFIISKNWQKSKLNGKSRKTYIKKLLFMQLKTGLILA